MSPRSLRTLVICFVVAVAALGHVRPSLAQDWLEVATPGFVVYTDAGERDGIRVARELEVVRAVFRSAFQGVRTTSNRPLVVIALEERDDLVTFFPSVGDAGRMQGAFRPGDLEHHIVLSTEGGGRRRYQVVYHEYFHLLSRLSDQWLPPWLEEGLAEFYSQLTVRGDTVELGDRRVDYLDFLTTRRLIPLDAMLSADADPHAGGGLQATQFYAQAWALVHFIVLGDDTGTGGQRIDAYIDRVGEGVDPRAAFEGIFGPLDDMERELARYVRRGSFFGYRLDTPSEIDVEHYEARPLTPAEALVVRAGVLAQGPRPGLARPLVDQAVSLEPTLARAYEVEGVMHWYRRESVPAAVAVGEAIDLGSDRYVPYYLAAVLAVEAGQTRTRREEIVGWLQRALTLQPTFAPAHMVLAGVLADQVPPPPEARAHARRAVELEPSTVGHWVVLGEVLLAEGRPREARDVGRQARERAETVAERRRVETFLARTRDPGATLARATELRSAGRLDEAERTYRVAMEMAPDDPRAHVGLGRVLTALGRRDDAVAAYERALAVDPMDRAAASEVGVILMDEGRFEEATTMLRRAVGDGLGVAARPDAAYDLGRALEATGADEEAVAAYRRIIALDPGHVAARTSLGLLLADRGEVDLAVEQLRLVTELDPTDPRGFQVLADLLQAAGQDAAADAARARADALR